MFIYMTLIDNKIYIFKIWKFSYVRFIKIILFSLKQLKDFKSTLTNATTPTPTLLLQIEHESSDQSTSIFNNQQKRVLIINYNAFLLPTSIQPAQQIEPIHFTYNIENKRTKNTRHNNNIRVTSWKRGALSLGFLYDKQMRLKEQRVNNMLYKRFLYNPSSLQATNFIAFLIIYSISSLYILIMSFRALLMLLPQM